LSNPCNSPGEADAAQCLPAGGKTANEHDPKAATPHRTKAPQITGEQPGLDHNGIGIYHQHRVPPSTK
jgi:hypothetical protein